MSSQNATNNRQQPGLVAGHAEYIKGATEVNPSSSLGQRLLNANATR